jgi:methylthioribose-1-phosphate isomerase
MKDVKTLFWKNSKLYILDQLLLPSKIKYIECSDHLAVAKTIKDMNVRGAPAIGVAAAFGVALACKAVMNSTVTQANKYIDNAVKVLAATRPTAVNLFWALERMKRAISINTCGGPRAMFRAAENEAVNICAQDIAANKRMGDYGASLLKAGSVVLTHCNAGALATAGYGTALGVVRSAHRAKKIKLVYVDETRPYLQGARLTAFEMKQAKIPYVLITDNMAGHMMKTAGINAVIVGADRIAANGDTANKIGTYSLSILAKYHNIPFYVAAPVSTVDLKTANGSKIVIEERSSDEVLYVNNKCIAPLDTVARHPGFDVTPAANITAIITEKGVFKPSMIKNINKA